MDLERVWRMRETAKETDFLRHVPSDVILWLCDIAEAAAKVLDGTDQKGMHLGAHSVRVTNLREAFEKGAKRR